MIAGMACPINLHMDKQPAYSEATDMNSMNIICWITEFAIYRSVSLDVALILLAPSDQP